jgi:hypothetical protein
VIVPRDSIRWPTQAVHSWRLHEEAFLGKSEWRRLGSNIDQDHAVWKADPATGFQTYGGVAFLQIRLYQRHVDLLSSKCQSHAHSGSCRMWKQNCAKRKGMQPRTHTKCTIVCGASALTVAIYIKPSEWETARLIRIQIVSRICRHVPPINVRFGISVPVVHNHDFQALERHKVSDCARGGTEESGRGRGRSNSEGSRRARFLGGMDGRLRSRPLRHCGLTTCLRSRLE